MVCKIMMSYNPWCLRFDKRLINDKPRICHLGCMVTNFRWSSGQKTIFPWNLQAIKTTGVSCFYANDFLSSPFPTSFHILSCGLAFSLAWAHLYSIMQLRSQIPSFPVNWGYLMGSLKGTDETHSLSQVELMVVECSSSWALLEK